MAITDDNQNCDVGSLLLTIKSQEGAKTVIIAIRLFGEPDNVAI